ncbi:hypothetical protein ABW20_dc0110455 [Dactylellina cionopaga]|nr:hypothetical protein ABW20_dc0110455 [Dactylellina cionopaga]
MVDRNHSAEIIRFSHPIILLGILYLTSASLVKDPPQLLFRLLPVTTSIQIAYVSGCLGNNKAVVSGPKKKPRTAAKGKLELISSNIRIASISLLQALSLGTLAVFTMIVLLGAPITTHLKHTTLCAAHFSLLAGFPLIYSHHVQASKWKDMLSLRLPMDEVYGGALGVCLGAWFGAIPIPLDWDREWQKWPVTIIVGMYAGYAAGRLGGLVLSGKVARL